MFTSQKALVAIKAFGIDTKGLHVKLSTVSTVYGDRDRARIEDKKFDDSLALKDVLKDIVVPKEIHLPRNDVADIIAWGRDTHRLEASELKNQYSFKSWQGEKCDMVTMTSKALDEEVAGILGDVTAPAPKAKKSSKKAKEF